MPVRSARTPSSQRTRSVSILPGAIRFTVMPFGPSSSASVLTSPWMPGRKTFENPRPGSAVLIEEDAIVTMRPWFEASRCGTAARAPRATDSSTDSKAFCHASSSNESRGPAGGPPVFVTRMSSPPNAVAAASTSRAGPSGVATSMRSPATWAPSSAMALACWVAVASLASSRPHSITFTPSRASAQAIALPMPSLDAMTAARRPTRSSSMAGTLHARRPGGSVRRMSTALSTLAEYARANPRSQAAYERALRLFPSGLTHDARRQDPFPPCVTHAEGAHKWDLDGHRLLDYVMGHGALVAGHSHPAVVEAVRRQAGLGMHLGASSELEADWAERIVGLVPSAERVRFTSSGTEATLLALRVARGFTARNRVLKLAGHFHGWHDDGEPGVALPVDPAAPVGIAAQSRPHRRRSVRRGSARGRARRRGRGLRDSRADRGGLGSGAARARTRGGDRGGRAGPGARSSCSTRS